MISEWRARLERAGRAMWGCECKEGGPAAEDGPIDRLGNG